MVHIVFAVYLCSLAAGSVAIGISIVVYRHSRRISLKYFIPFLLSLFSFLLSFLANQYSLIANIGDSSAVSVLASIFQMGGALLFTSSAPYFYHALLGKELSHVGRFLTGVLVAAVAGLIVLDIAVPGLPFMPVGWITLLGALILYGLLRIGLSFSEIGDKPLRRGILVFFIVTAAYFPLQLIDMLLGIVPALDAFSFLNNLVQPFYFLVISVLFAVFALKYFARPSYRSRGVLTDHFRITFGLSGRECEVVERLIAGEGAKQIADALCLSARTVENHIYRIFRKCDVKNRVQLHQIVMSNTSE